MLALLEHQLKLFWTVYFDIFRPSSFTIQNSWTVHFDTFGPYTLTFLDRSLLSFDSSGRSTFSRMTVHLNHWPFTLAQETVQFCATVHFHPFGPSTLARTRTRLFLNHSVDIHTIFFLKIMAWTWAQSFSRIVAWTWTWTRRETGVHLTLLVSASSEKHSIRTLNIYKPNCNDKLTYFLRSADYQK